MSQRYIAERLREHHENRDTPHACQKAILAYEEERHEAADEIQRLIDELSAVHGSASENDYSQWERITELEKRLTICGAMRPSRVRRNDWLIGISG